MTRYAVGDVQGCWDPLQQLLAKVQFDPRHDELWSVGDIVNRGPQSLECLRFFVQLGSAARVVLGNHDLHLLAVANGVRKLKRGDTLRPILDAPDRDQLLAWLIQQPLFYQAPTADYAMVHAGLAPQWSLADAQRCSDEVSAVLQSAQLPEFLYGMYGDTPDNWRDDLQGIERLRVITNYFTRLRFCSKCGELDLQNKEDADSAAPGFMPWFAVPGRKSAGANIIFGHWATLLGRAERSDVFALDTGCVWGNKLTLLNLESQALTQCEC
jgi:bis(5'-nucleosyl)-tetraphosphatase (symmetrical)